MSTNRFTPDPGPQLLLEVWTLAHNVGEFLDKALAGSGLNADEFGFYTVLYLKEPVTPNVISELTGMPPTTVSSYLSRLIARGHIERKRNPSDGRSALIELTQAGQETLSAAAGQFMPAAAAVEASLAMPLDRMIETLRTISEAVQAAAAQTLPAPS